MAFDVKAVLTSVQADVYKIEVLSAFGGATQSSVALCF